MHSTFYFRKFLTGIIELLIEDDVDHEFFKNDTEEVKRRVQSFLDTESAIADVCLLQSYFYFETGFYKKIFYVCDFE